VLLANGEGRVGVEAAISLLQQGAPALDAVEQGIRLVEADPAIHTVGLGGEPNLLGVLECDAALMEGTSRRAGAVGALRGYLHAVSVARGVMEQLPEVMVVGAGAARFAEEVGAEPAPARSLEAEARPRPLAQRAWEAARQAASGGTTVYLARDRQGTLAAGVSSSGRARKYPGRVGDSGVIGAGIYADSRYGACGCTHTGEMALRAGTARSVVWHLSQGASVEEACRAAQADLRRLQGGLLGPLVIHALGADGKPYVLCTKELGARAGYCYWEEGMVRPSDRQPIVCPL
jgi:L-asparaginase